MKKILSLILLAGCLMTANAKVTMPSVFADNMVLQQNTDVAFWGTADPGEKVTVSQTWSSEKAGNGP